MTLRIEPIRADLPFGSKVFGVSETSVVDEGVRQELRDAFEERGVLIFEDVDSSNRLQIAVSEVFGPLKEHPVKAVDLQDADKFPGVLEVTFDPADGDIVEIDGKTYSSWLPWHFDHCYNNELNRGGVLRVTRITPNGGNTSFIDGIEVYKEMPADLLAEIEDKNIIYSMDLALMHMRFGKPDNFKVLQTDPHHYKILEQAKTFPRAIHPAVWTRASGEKVFHFSPWMAEDIEGQPSAESMELLETISQELRRIGDRQAYRHQWKPTQMLIWDNWRMLHSVTGCTPPHPRRFSRTTIRGDYGLGRFENNDQGHYALLQRSA